YCYTGGPFPLAYRGLGDVVVLLFFGVVAVGGVYFLNTGRWDWPAGLAGLQIGLLATVLIAINNLRDHVTDRKANKRTLAVRWGVKGAKLQIALLCLTPFLGAVFWYAWGYKGAALLPLFSFPLALKISEKVYATEPGVLYNQFLAQAALLHFLFGVFFSLGLIQIF
ncbi:MAG: prenyltransferase, partial [Bdellovibrionia bacterium]